MRLAVALVFAFATTATGAAAEITKAPAAKTGRAIKVETFARGLVHPWGLAFLPDGRLLVTERPGRLRIVGKNGALSAPVQGTRRSMPAARAGCWTSSCPRTSLPRG